MINVGLIIDCRFVGEDLEIVEIRIFLYLYNNSINNGNKDNNI